jgi:hypothetical protein
MQIWQLLTLETWMQLFLDGGARTFAETARAQPIARLPQLATA